MPEPTVDHKFRCGDTARIEGTDYDIEIAYADYENGRASWCGWPDGIIYIKKLTLVAACSDAEHRAAVARWLDGPVSSDLSRAQRRATIKRLYRPRAYWRDVVALSRALVQEATAALSRAENELLRAQAEGGEDA